MRIWPLAVLAVSGCAGNNFDLRPPVEITQTLKPGEVIECSGYIMRIALPTYDFPVIGFAKRTWSCKLRLEDPTARLPL